MRLKCERNRTWVALSNDAAAADKQLGLQPLADGVQDEVVHLLKQGDLLREDHGLRRHPWTGGTNWTETGPVPEVLLRPGFKIRSPPAQHPVTRVPEWIRPARAEAEMRKLRRVKKGS
jgi:hypothetical protein